MSNNPLDKQIGGNHYDNGGIQHVEWAHSNNMEYIEANICKYVARHAKKNGKQDLMKARHYIDILIKLQYDDKAVEEPKSEAERPGFYEFVPSPYWNL